ncbi:glycerol-3-phosphate phosphatase-like isoform X4 [Periplaneta americana]|uniref:glycerol-3-phosphate phosphatase-like isoform X4 n=1 Tax=Periplaneta americana TaxID=6978 RepID=UPI0037E99477
MDNDVSVLWLGNIVIPGSPHAITELAKLGKNVFYVTNNSTKSREEYVSKFTNLGYPATKENILSTAYLAACYLQDLGFKKKVYVVGAKGITQELDAVGIKHLDVGPDPLDSDMNTLLAKEVHLDSEVGAVVVGFDEHISFPKMVKAASYLKQPDCIFVATNTDETFPTEFPLTVPDCVLYIRNLRSDQQYSVFMEAAGTATRSDSLTSLRRNELMEECAPYKYKQLYFEILDNILTQLESRFQNYEKLKLLELSDTTRFSIYSQHFPTEALDSLFQNYETYFDSVKLRVELQTVFSPLH